MSSALSDTEDRVGTFSSGSACTWPKGPTQDRRPGFKLLQCLMLGKIEEGVAVGVEGLRGDPVSLGLILS